ncbi:MAG: NUDIX hydrolase [Planctomycetota bacterium]
MAHDLHPDAETLVRGSRLTVKRATVHDPAGQPHTREIAEVADAVVILPLLDNGDVVLIQNRRFAVNQTLWELPAGTIEADEVPADCAGRELEEETGYRAATITPLTSFYPTPGFCTEKLHAFLATGLTATQQALDPTEAITPHPTPLEQTMNMIRTGEIEDAKTIAALLFYTTFLKTP